MGINRIGVKKCKVCGKAYDLQKFHTGKELDTCFTCIYIDDFMKVITTALNDQLMKKGNSRVEISYKVIRVKKDKLK